LANNEIQVNRPEPIAHDIETGFFDNKTEIDETIGSLLKGQNILIKGYYSNGLTLVHALHKHLNNKYPNKSFQDQRKLRNVFQKISQFILIEVNHQKLVVKKAPFIGWLEKLYPDAGNFLLPFTKIQGLNSSWQWYQKGIKIPVLRNKIHPYYGTYFPTRFEHLLLFDNWLKRYQGVKNSAIDVGIGCGILALQMMKYGFQKVYGTDINPNAIIGLRESMEGTKLSRKIELSYGQLFGKWDKPTELIVFNPPWLPATHDLDGMDEAIYYNEELFPEFFEEAKKRLQQDGNLVLLFSNLGQMVDKNTIHPIEKELADVNRFKLKLLLKKSVKSAPEKAKRNKNLNSNEEIQLWVLSHK
jgi:hypothetical protein